MADEPIIKRVRSEFQEMPGLQLTAAQAQRLWNLERETCCVVLDTLVDSGFLRYGDDSRYRLSTSDPIRQPVRQKSVKADAPAPRRRNRDHAA